MKKLLMVVIIAAGGYAGYLKWTELQGKNTAATPASTTTTAAAPAAGSHLAPAGTYYTTQRVSVTTSTGVVSVAPGTKLTMVKSGSDGMSVTDGENQFDVTPSQVTNDMDVVGHMGGQGSSQASVKLDPNGTYYLLQTVSVTTDSGVTGIAPGTKLSVVSITDTGARVTDGTNQFDVTASQVTSNLATAQKVMGASQAAQAQLANQVAAQEQAHAEQLKQQAAASAAAAPTPAAAGEAPMGSSSMDAPYDSTKNIQVDSLGRHFWVDTQGVRHYVN